ncbi:L-rhamnose mutarotase [Arthrobacter koreensis]|uniref:L-rhamnose mutarotase n=1 Tax=Arthrobacter koreensis TaxID=199136 RepID=A0ABY6FSU0_9MICC|nr:L-rhamnose mutarotase [Arthrobacter koreensis]MEB7446769.1 L-rhamnose mutarotase [Arthrobacter koreensis]UYB35831.1 L-rhamnose mutarotase [Arthrobacter koreensis]
MGSSPAPADLQELVQLPAEITATRGCFLLHIRPERLAEYVEVHQRVWPEMLDALRETGWRNYSLFLRPEDGLVVGYFEAENAEATQKLMDAHPVNTRWQAEMAQYFTEGSSPQALTQYFHLS